MNIDQVKDELSTALRGNATLQLKIEELEGTVQTALDILVEGTSSEEHWSYDYKARRKSFINTEMRKRTKGVK